RIGGYRSCDRQLVEAADPQDRRVARRAEENAVGDEGAVVSAVGIEVECDTGAGLRQGKLHCHERPHSVVDPPAATAASHDVLLSWMGAPCGRAGASMPAADNRW